MFGKMSFHTIKMSALGVEHVDMYFFIFWERPVFLIVQHRIAIIWANLIITLGNNNIQASEKGLKKQFTKMCPSLAKKSRGSNTSKPTSRQVNKHSVLRSLVKQYLHQIIIISILKRDPYTRCTINTTPKFCPAGVFLHKHLQITTTLTALWPWQWICDLDVLAKYSTNSSLFFFWRGGGVVGLGCRVALFFRGGN